MELRQLRYFVKIIEQGSLGRAALELDVGVSALSQQIAKLESELCTRLLNRTTTGVTPTTAGMAFLHHAQLSLRQADNAILAAHRGRMSGYVTVGLPPTTATVLALPLIDAMRERYPDIQLHLVEMLSGHLAAQLNARQLDLAILFQLEGGKRWSVTPLLDERLFVISAPQVPHAPHSGSVQLADLGQLPLIMPSVQHGLRSTLMTAFERSGLVPNIIMEVDGLAVLMNAVRAGHAATIQPGAAAALKGENGLEVTQISDAHVGRRNLLATLADDELSPAALAARRVVLDVARRLVAEQQWPGATWIADSSC
ncbi:LysR family transcriptional regulator [Pseudomonas putida CSV86]|uniref:LysR family transcriptional regulator n=2 Tax=Pseudomonas TaxID=286 RepID=A0A177SSZ9_PSEPU|nr:MULTISPECIES: LysR substrate-binding domain-containing protein [Pseudomonas]MDG9884216.1 LysR substrate-binding domain-containing protein [Pseudomonas sp. GD04058]NNJ16268.1 LysR family transcriptional regulator [Pseudomonas bharatica CSV86]OAI94112.1 LysR family transcriptional regulator [Pseudomonas putida]